MVRRGYTHAPRVGWKRSATRGRPHTGRPSHAHVGFAVCPSFYQAHQPDGTAAACWSSAHVPAQCSGMACVMQRVQILTFTFVCHASFQNLNFLNWNGARWSWCLSCSVHRSPARNQRPNFPQRWPFSKKSAKRGRLRSKWLFPAMPPRSVEVSLLRLVDKLRFCLFLLLSWFFQLKNWENKNKSKR
jgi:hypothetical protein